MLDRKKRTDWVRFDKSLLGGQDEDDAPSRERYQIIAWVEQALVEGAAAPFLDEVGGSEDIDQRWQSGGEVETGQRP